jgi:ribosomal protein S18 acetylase RimI-like enzyme
VAPPLISIRRAQAHDHPFLAAMLAEAVNWDPRQVALSAETVAADPQLDRYVAGWPRSTDLGVVAEADGVPVGAAWLRMFDPRAPGYGFIAEGTPELSIGVLPAWRDRGVGGRILDALFELARADRIQAISLSVAAANPARRLYERHGFVPVAEAGDAITMRLDLDAGAS